MSKKRAFVRYTKSGEIVPGSLIVTTNGGYPDKSSLWQEVTVDQCCDSDNCIPSLFTPIELCYGSDPCIDQCTVETYYIYQNVIFGIPVVYLLNSENPEDRASTGQYRIESNGKRMVIGSNGTIVALSNCA